MNQPKNIIILVFMLLAFGLTANAQSSALNPYEGATHTYAWSGVTQGLNYDFYITANADGSGMYNDDLTGEFDILNATGVVGADGKAATGISWNTGAAANVYYMWLEVTSTSGCSNYRYVRVTPQTNQFDLLSENVPVTNTISCPATASEDGFNPGSDTYAAGSTVLQFKVTRANGTDNTLTASAGDTYDWSFIPQLMVDPDLGLSNVIITIEGAKSGVVLADVNNRYQISGLDNDVTVTVSIQNAPGYDLKVDMKVTGQKEHNTNLSDSDPTNDNVTHTIQVMPVIGGMGGV
ncbi:MAG: hypothetical protein ACERKD_02245 [Prolixibacteraceae bacterium]